MTSSTELPNAECGQAIQDPDLHLFPHVDEATRAWMSALIALMKEVRGEMVRVGYADPHWFDVIEIIKRRSEPRG